VDRGQNRGKSSKSSKTESEKIENENERHDVCDGALINGVLS
jgi:hypothetical protein